jgi:hypothetical protein
MGLVGEFRNKRFNSEADAFAELVKSYGGQYTEAQLRKMGWRYVAA